MKKKIIVVDDLVQNRESAKLLCELGYEVEVYSSYLEFRKEFLRNAWGYEGEMAIQSILADKAKAIRDQTLVVLTDLWMPEQRAFEGPFVSIPCGLLVAMLAEKMGVKSVIYSDTNGHHDAMSDAVEDFPGFNDNLWSDANNIQFVRAEFLMHTVGKDNYDLDIKVPLVWNGVEFVVGERIPSYVDEDDNLVDRGRQIYTKDWVHLFKQRYGFQEKPWIETWLGI